MRIKLPPNAVRPEGPPVHVMARTPINGLDYGIAKIGKTLHLISWGANIDRETVQLFPGRDFVLITENPELYAEIL